MVVVLMLIVVGVLLGITIQNKKQGNKTAE
jgi:hypothetical protein